MRSRFENRLRDNLIQMFARDGIEALVERGQSRIYVRTGDIEGAVRCAGRVFGVASISVAEVCGSDLDSICACAAEYSVPRMVRGKSYAVKARRTGNQKYTSLELGRIVGDAIWNANPDKDPRVDLTDPDITFYVEARDNAAYIFDGYIRCHAGLPVGTQGHVVAQVDDDRGILAAWLMMKRGCRLYVRGSADMSVLEAYDPGLKVLGPGDRAYKAKGYVFGSSIRDAEDFDVSAYDLPVYFPTVAMDDDEVARRMAEIRKGIGPRRTPGYRRVCGIPPRNTS